VELKARASHPKAEWTFKKARIMHVVTSPVNVAKRARLSGRAVGAAVVVVALLSAPWIDHSYRFLSLAIFCRHRYHHHLWARHPLRPNWPLFDGSGRVSGCRRLYGGKTECSDRARLLALDSVRYGSVGDSSRPTRSVFDPCCFRSVFHHCHVCLWGTLQHRHNKWGAFTGGALGIDVGPIGSIFGIDLDNIHDFYYLTMLFVLASILATHLISISRYGRTLRSIRENELLARSVAVVSGFHKIAVFMLSGVFAGLAGVLQAHYLQHISPALYDTFPSVYLALMVMIGGPRMLYGPLAGAAIIYFLPEIMHLDPIDARIAYGAALVLVIMLLPRGLIGGFIDLFHWARTLERRLRRPLSGEPK